MGPLFAFICFAFQAVHAAAAQQQGTPAALGSKPLNGTVPRAGAGGAGAGAAGTSAATTFLGTTPSANDSTTVATLAPVVAPSLDVTPGPAPATSRNQDRCNSTDETLLEELECLEPKQFKDAGDPAWAWVSINGLFAAAILVIVPFCCACSLKVARSSRELRQFRAPLQEEVMELSETSLGVVDVPSSARSGLTDQATTGAYASMQ